MKRLLEIMKTLRGPDGCSWDREQTHLSLRPYLLEEAAEAVDALSSGNVQDIPDELGDVLLQETLEEFLGGVSEALEGSMDMRQTLKA